MVSSFKKRKPTHSIELITMISNHKWFNPVRRGNPHWQKSELRTHWTTTSQGVIKPLLFIPIGGPKENKGLL